MMNVQKNAITIKRALLIFAIIIFTLTCIAGCGKTVETDGMTEGVAESSFRNQMANDRVKEINVKNDMVLEAPVEVNGTKVLYGGGSITAVGEGWTGEDYMFVVSSGAQLTVKDAVVIDANGVAGGVHASQGAVWSIEETASVVNASAQAANTLVEGAFQMNGGTMSGALGHNVYNKGEVTLSEGEIVGSGDKFAGIYNEGTLTQNGGTIREAYNNVAVLSGSFKFNGGNNLDSVRDGIFMAEGTKLSVTSKEAVITGSGVRGIYLCGEATIDGIALNTSGDSLVKISKTGTLNLNGGTLTDSGYHSVENAGKMVMTGGSIRNSYNCAIVNTGTLEVTGGSFLDNVKNKAVLNKHNGKATISQGAMFSGNRFAVANEDTATLDLSKAEMMLTTGTNVYAYDGTVNIHDISLGASNSNNVRIYKADVTMTDVQILGNSSSGSGTTHGILLEGGTLKAENITIKNTTGYGIRNKGGQVTVENLLISKSSKAGGIHNTVQDHTGLPGNMIVNNLTIEECRYNNVVVDGGSMTVTNGKLDASGTNNIKVTGGVLSLKDVDVLGNQEGVDGTNHVVYSTGGTIEAEDVLITNAKVNCLRMNGETAVFNGKNVVIQKSGSGKYGIDISNGQINIDGLTMTDNHYNIINSGGNIKLRNATLGPTVSNNVRVNKGSIDLRNVVIKGHTPDHVKSVHAIFVDGGTLTGSSISTYNVSDVGLRLKKGSVNVRGLTFNGTGKDAVWVSGGKATINNLTIKQAGGAGVSITDSGSATVIGGTINNTVSHGAKSEQKATLTLKNITVSIATTNGRHAVLAQGGDIHLEDVKITGLEKNTNGFGIRINKDTSHVSGKNVSIADVNTGISATAGTCDLSGMTTKNISAHSAYAATTAKLVISDSEFGITGTNNAKAESGGTLTLKNSVIKGTTKNHGIMVEKGGYFYGKALTVQDTAGSAVRVKTGDAGNYVEIDGLVTKNIGDRNVWINKDETAANVASVIIKNADLCRTVTHNVQAEAGNLTLIDTTIQGHKEGTANNIHAVYISNKTEKATLKGINVLDSAGDALRVGAGDVQSTDFTSAKTGRYGIWADDGKLTATNTTLSGSQIGVYATGTSSVVLNGLDVSGSSSNNISVNAVELIVNGYADGRKSQIGTSDHDNIVATDNGVIYLNAVNVLESATNNIVATKGKVYVTDSTVTGGDYSVLAQDAAYVQLNNVTITDPVKDGIRVNKADGKVVASNVQIINPVRYGISAQKGTVDLAGALSITSDAKKSGAIYVYDGGNVSGATGAAINISGTENGVIVEGATATLANIAITNCAKNGVKLTSGSTQIDGINVSGSGSNNILVTGGELTVNGYADGTLSRSGACAEDNIRASGEGIIRLNKVSVSESAKNNVVAITGGTVYMDNSAVTSGNHSVLADQDGKVYLNNVAIRSSVTSGIRANHSGSVVEATGLVIDGANTGLSIKSGNIKIDNVQIRNTKAIGVSVAQGDSSANVTINNLTTENCGTHAIYTSGADAKVTVNGATLGNDGSDHVVNLNGGPLVLNDVAINGGNLAAGKYELYSGAGFLTIGGAMDANVYIATGRVIKVNKELTGNNLVVDWSTTPSGTVLEFSSVDMMNASKDNIVLGEVQTAAHNYLEYYSEGSKGYAKLLCDYVPSEMVVTSEAELNDYLSQAAAKNMTEVTILIGANFEVAKQVTIPTCFTKVTIQDDGDSATGNTVTYTGSTDGLFVMHSSLKLTVNDISLASTQKALLKQATGNLELNDVNLSGKTNNIYVTGGKATINGGTIAKSSADSIRAEGTGIIELNNVESLGSSANGVVAINGGKIIMTDSSVTGGGHSILAQEGEVTLNNVTIRNSTNSAIRANRATSVVKATNVTIEGAKTGLSIQCGDVNITDITIRNTTDVGVNVAQSSGVANVTINNLVTENCGTHTIYTSGADAKLTVKGATLANDGSDHVVNLNGGPMVLNDVAINGANLASGKYELYSGAGWLTIGGEMDANIYIATDPGRVIKVNKELTGNNLVVDWKVAPTGNALEFTSAAMMDASMDNINLGNVQIAAGNWLYAFNTDGKCYAKLVSSKVTNETQLKNHLTNMAEQGFTDVTVLVGGSFDVASQLSVPATITSLTIRDDGNSATTNNVSFTANVEGMFNVGNGLKLTVQNISMTSTKNVLLKQSGGELVVDNCVLDGANKNILQDSGKLTVRNASLKLTTSNNVTINESLTLEGNVVVEAPTTAENVHGLYFNKGDITINGTVTVTGAKGSSIQCGNNTRLTISESATVNINGGGRAGLLVGHQATVLVKGALSIANTTGPAVYVGYWNDGACSLTIANGGSVTVGKDANGNGINNVGIQIAKSGKLEVQSGGSLSVSDTTKDGINVADSGVIKLAGNVNASVVSKSRPVEVTGALTGNLKLSWSAAPADGAVTFASEAVMNAFKEAVTGGQIQISGYTLQYANEEPWKAILVSEP